MADQSAYQLLEQIRDETMAMASDKVEYSTQSDAVKNVAYVVNGINFYCEASDIKEISTCDNLMVVPQTKRWMRGLVNSKGVLYSVTDLSLFAGFDKAVQENRGHLLLLSNVEMQSALLVNKVIGFRYFNSDDKLADLDINEHIPDGISAFVSEAFKVDDETWFRLEIDKLIASEPFREVQ